MDTAEVMAALGTDGHAVWRTAAPAAIGPCALYIKVGPVSMARFACARVIYRTVAHHPVGWTNCSQKTRYIRLTQPLSQASSPRAQPALQ